MVRFGLGRALVSTVTRGVVAAQELSGRQRLVGVPAEALVLVARAAFTLRQPASCNEKSTRSSANCCLSDAISPRSCSAVSTFLTASATCASRAAIFSLRSAICFS